MKISIDFDNRLQEAVLIPEEINEYEWNSFLRILNDYAYSVILKENKIYLPWKCFLIVKNEIVKYAKSHSITIKLTEAIKPVLKEANVQSYSFALKQKTLSLDDIHTKLTKRGFIRKLTDNQLNNLSKLGPLPAGATFSVPGAGKTTEALAYYFLNSEVDDRLLVVAPKNAFGAWDEQLSACVPTERNGFVRLRGGEKSIEIKLNDKPKYMIITYQQYPRVKNLIKDMLLQDSVFMFLDESHRIKSGRTGISADAILDISYLPKRKLIMSGTPMPQSIKDIIPQYSFLYPEKSITEDIAIPLLHPIYVRTTKGQLGIPPVEHRLISLKMDTLQEQIYQTLKSETKRQLIPILSDSSKFSLRQIGKKIMKVMQFVSNPALLAGDMTYAFDRCIGELLLKNNGPKIEYACHRARELVADGKKVLIWSSFVQNVELITARLSDLGADYIHGGVDAGTEDEDDTREWKIKEFHDNPNKMVLVANPAAASEGISLHKVCQYAIYVDRNFNAAQYLQSEDRIHRLGLLPEQKPVVEIIECKNTIDQLIRKRLEDKIQRMSAALNDSSLNVDIIPYDYEYIEDEGVTNDDVQEIIQYFFGSEV
ncbi:SNF2-related protein [Alloiococcus sp. CFN-8]|uniref:SNF2-related protein n=1 Tax=Alloiococcus sp. CFN-8 TaxID=3416081 RepID=UPI003CE743B1